MTSHRMGSTEVLEVLNRPISRELLSGGGQLARVAYVAKDGTPRAIPIGFYWNGAEFEIYTVVGSEKTAALRANPKVALTIDTDVFPPRALLVRGVASTIELVDGVPDGYIKASRNGIVTDELAAEFEANVRALYQQMWRILITPEWARLLDFETTAPRAVERLAEEQERERQRESAEA